MDRWNRIDVDANGRKILFRRSSRWCTYDDSRPILFSEQIVRHIRDDGTPVIENILDRPLLGVPVMPPNMYQKLRPLQDRAARPPGPRWLHGGPDLRVRQQEGQGG